MARCRSRCSRGHAAEVTVSDSLSDGLDEALRDFDVDPDPKLIERLVEVAERHGEWWDEAQIRRHVATIKDAAGVRAWCARHRVKRKTLARAEDVRRAKAAQRGVDWRKGTSRTERYQQGQMGRER